MDVRSVSRRSFVGTLAAALGYLKVAPADLFAQGRGAVGAQAAPRARMSVDEYDAVAKIANNENPYGPSPRALAALGAGKGFHLYPDPCATALRRALSAYSGVPVG